MVLLQMNTGKIKYLNCGRQKGILFRPEEHSCLQWHYPFTKLLTNTTRSRKIQIKFLFEFIPLDFDCRKKKRTTCNPSLNTDTALGDPCEPEALTGSTGPIRNQPPYYDTPSRLMSPVDYRMVLMIPACCVQ